VLAALSTIARWEHTTVMALLREAARDAVRKRVALPAHAAELRAMIAPMAPRMPPRFKTAAQLARFKRAQREFDPGGARPPTRHSTRGAGPQFSRTCASAGPTD